MVSVRGEGVGLGGGAATWEKEKEEKGSEGNEWRESGRV